MTSSTKGRGGCGSNRDGCLSEAGRRSFTNSPRPRTPRKTARSTGSVSSSRTEAMSALWGQVEELQGNVVGILGVQVQAAFILDDP